MGRVLNRLGFNFVSQHGSHMKFVRFKLEGGKETIIMPNHKILRKGILHNILKKLDLGIDKLKDLL